MPSAPPNDAAKAKRSSSGEAASRRIVLEGGSIDVNGRGDLLTTEECLLSEVQARNPGLGREGTQRALAQNLSASRVIWLGDGVVGDDTHGHVDDLARFVAEDHLLLAQESDPDDANFALLKDNKKRLAGRRTRAGKPLRVTALPMPSRVVFDGIRLPASYANFYIGNRVVLCPTFNDVNDRKALTILEKCFPDRLVVGIHAVDLVWGLGTLHCMTQQEPLSGIA